MDKNQKIVVILLVIAIIFSVISVIISLGISNIDLSQFEKPTYVYKSQTRDVGFANIGLTVTGGENERR